MKNIQDNLLDIIGSLLLEARYPLAVEKKKLEKISKKLRKVIDTL